MTDHRTSQGDGKARPEPGRAIALEPGLRCILAPNPSPMTWHGTNTYLLGDTDLAVIDPGPDSTAHLDAILAALRPGQRIRHIVVTHAHLDHSPLARPLAAETGAPVLAFGGAQDGRSEVMTMLAQSGLSGGGEGVDRAFRPDIRLCDGDRIDGAGWSLDVIHTPGHMGNHIALGRGDTCFTGDHVMGWASSLVSPPDGDMTDFLASCRRLQSHPWRRFFPGHGAPVETPAARLDWLVRHREARETAILRHLSAGPANATELATEIYADTPPALLPMAARNVFAHLVDMTGKNRVHPDRDLAETARFHKS
ncbi:MAG: MBL fold metallo-hydrolase [Marinibacterium sp.]